MMGMGGNRKKEEEDLDDFMTSQYNNHSSSMMSIQEEEEQKQEEGEDTIAFVGRQYEDVNTKRPPPLEKKEEVKSPPVKVKAKEEVSPDNKRKVEAKQEEVQGKKPLLKSQSSRKVELGKKAKQEYLRLVAEKEKKANEEEEKKKAFLEDVERRRREATLNAKAKRKRNGIFASQRNGLRKRLVAEWDLLSDDQKISVRALRSRRHIKCDICGTLGYYTEICPNKCFVEDDDQLSHVESMFAKPLKSGYNDDNYEEKAKEGKGFLWGTSTTYAQEAMKPEREKIHRGNVKANLNPLRKNTQQEKEVLQQLDSTLPGYSFHCKASVGYHRDHSEMTLHKVLRFVMRTMEAEVTKNAEKLENEKDYDLFHPPFEKPGADFYPKEIWDIKDHREYLTKQTVKKDRKMNQAHTHQGSVRPDEAMGAYLRGGGQKELTAIYNAAKRPGQCMHSKIGWKNILSTGDDLAIADPKMQAKMDEMEKLMMKQKAWTRVQKKAFENTNERFLHLWSIIKEEITKEHDREYRLLSVDEHSNLYETQRAVWTERLQAADLILDTLTKYSYINGTNEADYAIQSLRTWRKELMESSNRKFVAPQGRSVIPKKKKKKKKLGKRMFTSMGVQQRAADAMETDEQVDDDSDTESAATMDTDTRVKMANLGTVLATSNKGGYKGLGFASEFDIAQKDDGYDCNAAITAALLSGGASSLFEVKSPTKAGDAAFNKSKKKKKETPKATDRAIFKKLVLDYKIPQQELDRRKMAEVEKKFNAVGMERNIRGGTNEDNSQFTPSLIPMHEVFSASRDDHISSKVADEILLKARLSRTNGITGYIGQEYVPMYVRNTLFEQNGCTEGGDQTYESMGKDSRYSGQMGRTMQSLEPSKDEQKILARKVLNSTRQNKPEESLPKVKQSKMKW